MTNQDKREQFAMVPDSLTRDSGISDSAKTLYGYCDRKQGDDGWSATGYMHTATYLNWSPKKVRNAAKELEGYGWLKIANRTGKDTSQAVMIVIHNPARGRCNPDVIRPEPKVLKSLEKALPPHERQALSDRKTEPLVPASTSRVPVSTPPVRQSAQGHRSSEVLNRSMGDLLPSERNLRVQENAAAISDENFSEAHPELDDLAAKFQQSETVTASSPGLPEHLRGKPTIGAVRRQREREAAGV